MYSFNRVLISTASLQQGVVVFSYAMWQRLLIR